jgi:hypothetical protein
MKLPRLIFGALHPEPRREPRNRAEKRRVHGAKRYFHNRALAGAMGRRSAYQINSSLLFRGAQSIYRAFTTSATVGMSVYVRRGKLGAISPILGSAVKFNANDTLTAWSLTTTAVFRDPHSVYHIQVQSGRLYVNERDMGAVTTSAFTCSSINCWGYDGTNYFHGWMAEPILTDGSQPAWGATGEADPVTLNWRPKRPSGITYGSNGCYLGQGGWTFASLGTNAAGTGAWTANGFASTDVLADSPTNIYATLSPLNNFGNVTGGGTFSEGNLRYAMASAGYSGPMASLDAAIISTPYWEVTYKAGGQYATFGAANELFVQGTNGDVGAQANGWGVIPGFGLYHGGVRIVALGSVVADDVFMFAYKASTKGLYIGFKGQWFNSSGVLGAWNEAAPTYTVTGNQLFPTVRAGNGADVVFNFGQRAWAYTPPTGFKALCTSNLPATTGATGGSFTGTANTDGPCIWTGAVPETLTIDGNAVTWGTHALKLSTGFKIITASSPYNQAGTRNWTATYNGKPTVGPTGRAPANAQGNP